MVNLKMFSSRSKFIPLLFSKGAATLTPFKIIKPCPELLFGVRRHQSTGDQQPATPQLIHPKEAVRFMTDCFCAAGVPMHNSEEMAALLIAADVRGALSHGMNRLEMYLNGLQDDVIDATAVPSIIRETKCSAYVDGCNALGVVVGNFCMDVAIKKAKTDGVCCVSAKNSNHFGVCCYYMHQAIKNGMIGMTMTNTPPFLVPTRSKQPMLGTNPISCGAPAIDTDHFLIDTSTTMVAMGKVEIQRRKKEPVPEGWAQGPDGKLTTDSEVAANTAALRPLGGGEDSGGYKGYGLGCVVDILCGVLSGAYYSTQIARWGKPSSGNRSEGTPKPANIGHIFMVVNPEFFAPCFRENMSEFLAILRNCCPIKKELPVLAAGDLEIIRMKEVDDVGGVLYSADQLSTCQKLSERFKVEPIKTVQKN